MYIEDQSLGYSHCLQRGASSGGALGWGLWFDPAPSYLPCREAAVAALKTCILQGLGGESVDVKKQRVHTAMSRTAANVLSLLLFLVGGAFSAGD